MVWSFGNLRLNQFCGHEKSWSTSCIKTRTVPMMDIEKGPGLEC